MEDGGFEIEIVLDEAPDTDVFDFAVEGADDFFYKPAISGEEIAEGAIRPENVVGSYAVYHKTQGNHRIGETSYATGKTVHFYRPKAIDALASTVMPCVLMPRAAIAPRHPKRSCRQRLLSPTLRSGQRRHWPTAAGL